MTAAAGPPRSRGDGFLATALTAPAELTVWVDREVAYLAGRSARPAPGATAQHESCCEAAANAVRSLPRRRGSEHADQLLYPFSAPPSTPRLNWPWNTRKNSTTGMIMSIVPAASKPTSAVRPVVNMYNPVASGRLS